MQAKYFQKLFKNLELIQISPLQTLKKLRVKNNQVLSAYN